MRFAEIDPITLEIIDVYNNYALIDKVSDTFIKIPENLNYQCIEAYRDESGVILLRHISDTETIEKITKNNLNSLRSIRDDLLKQSDWVTLKAYSTDTPVPDEWKTYMQALRDLPSNTEDPANPVWPVAPQ
jgi:3-methyladenine DNA glycosylase AlkD